MLSATLANRPPGNGTCRPHRRSNEGPQRSVAQQKQLLLQMVHGQLDDSTEFGDLLELQEQIRALQTELAEVKQADDEELDKLLDQNAEMQLSIAQARSAQEQAVQAVKVAGQKIAQLETANADLRVANRQLKVQADESSSKQATKLKSAEQEAKTARQTALTTQSELQKVQASHDQVASKLSLAEMQLVELQAKRLEGLQAADTVKQQAVQLASSKSQAASALAAQKAAEQVSQEKQVRIAKLEASLQESQAKVQQAEGQLQKQVDQLQQELLVAQQTLHEHRHRHPQRSRSRASSQGPSQEAPPSIRQQQDDRQLALLPTTLRQGDEEAGLSREVGALRGLLARVAPQLEELVGVKQQMCHLLSVLQPGTSGSGQQQQGMGSASQAMITMSSPEAIAPSSIVQMAKSPNPFAAMHNAEPPPFPGPMFSGLNAIVNPFSTSRPSSAAANTRGNAVESGVSGAGGRRRTDSPASGDTWDTVRQQAHSPGTRLACTKKSNGSPAQHSNQNGALRSTRGWDRKSPRGRGAASPRRGRSPQRPSGKAAHWEERQPQGSAYAAERASGRAAEREARRAHSSSGGQSPKRHSSSAERSAKQASLSRTLSRSGSGSGPEDRRRAGSGGASHRQPSQRSLSLLGPRPSTPSTPSPVVAETGTPLLSKLATLPAHLQGGFVLGASLRVDTPQGAIKPNQALVPSAAEAAAAEVVSGGDEVAEEAEEGELEPGERGADWESDPEEEAGSQAEPAEASGTKQPSTTAPEAGKSQQNGVDKTLPASQHVPLGVGTVSTQRPDLAPAPQSGYHSGGNPATAVARKATAVKSGQATSGGSQSTVSQKSATKGQPHPWQQQQPRFQGGPTQQMGPLQPEQGGGFQAGAQQGPQWQQGNSHPAFQAGFMPGQRGPSSGPGSGPHMQGHHHGVAIATPSITFSRGN
ncbi:hypothetical protein WJX82_000133 [Trebouxia sp. C0006]